MQKLGVGAAAALAGAVLTQWLQNAGFTQSALAFVLVTCALFIVLNSIGWSRLHELCARDERRRRMGALVAFIVAGALGAFGWYAFTGSRTSPPSAAQINAVMRWNKFEETLEHGWKLRAWVNVTSRSEKPMVLSFGFRIADETKPPSFPRIFMVRLDGTETNTVEVPAFSHRMLLLVITLDNMQPEPIDVADVRRQYWLHVEEQVTGAKLALRPLQQYEVGSVPTESSPAVAPPAAPAPGIIQGPGSIAQLGDNNQATINNVPPPWTLSAEQKAVIASVATKHLALWKQQPNVISAVNGDPDSGRMAQAFIESFRAGGWNITTSTYTMYSQPHDGVQIHISSSDKDSPTVNAFLSDMAEALRRIGLVKGPLDVTLSAEEAGRFTIRVGRRPVTP